jgi:hypothetical protein
MPRVVPSDVVAAIDRRPLQCRVVKDLYDIRSRLVHGDARMKTGTITWDSFHISQEGHRASDEPRPNWDTSSIR